MMAALRSCNSTVSFLAAFFLLLVRQSCALAVQCRSLGRIEPAKTDTEESSFLTATGVSTYICHDDDDDDDGSRHLVGEIEDVSVEAVEPIHGKWGPALHILHVLPESVCQDIKRTCEESLGFGNFCAGKNQHGAMQLLVTKQTANVVAKRIKNTIDLKQVEERKLEMELHSGILVSRATRLEFSGINRRWRVYRYQPDATESFAPHIDAGFPASGIDENGWFQFDMGEQNTISRLTLLLYLNENFAGGETAFYEPSSAQVLAKVRPVTGSALIFPQAVGTKAVELARELWPLHEGTVLRSGPEPKYVIRSDVLFREVEF